MLASDSKVDLLQAFGPAWEAKNPAFINMQYLQQVAPERAAVLAQQFTALVQYEDARVGQVVNQVHTMAGGAEQWQAAVTAFKQNAPAEVQAVLASMVDSGNPAQVQYAVQQILQTARQSGSVPFVQQPFLQGNQATGAGAMTKEAFAKAEQALSKQYPVGSPQYNSQYEALVQQRAQARALGY
jgi:cysteinyl-tRNA synthetase